MADHIEWVALSVFIFFFALVFGWLFLKPWAPIFTLLFALFGFFVPLMSYFAGTGPASTIVPGPNHTSSDRNPFGRATGAALAALAVVLAGLGAFW